MNPQENKSQGIKPIARLLTDLRTRISAFRDLEKGLSEDFDAAPPPPLCMSFAPAPAADLSSEPPSGFCGLMLDAEAAVLRHGAFSRGRIAKARESSAIDPSATVTFTLSVLPRPAELPIAGIQPKTGDQGFWRKILRLLSPEEPFLKRFLIKRPLGLGGASQVFEAEDLQSKLPVALKIIPPPYSEPARRALESAVKLRHPNIISTLDFGPTDLGGLYVVMPLLHGTTLRNLLPAGKAPSSAFHALMVAFRKVCEGMRHAHSQGIIHRDLKPANIHVGSDGRTVVIDWDFACAPSWPAGSEVIGTPLYMAPEQLEGGELTPAIDIYALGVILFEILTGNRLSGPGDSVRTILFRKLHETPPPPSTLNQKLPEEFDPIVQRCLLKNPKVRYQHAGELLEDLEGVA